MKKLLLAATAACLLCPSAMATPVLSGDYAILFTRTCQIVVHVNKKNHTVKFADQDTSDAVTNHLASTGVISFNQADGTYVWNGDVSAVSAILEKFSDGTTKGTTGEAQSFSANSHYSNTDTTLNLDSIPYHVVYSGIDQNGVAHGFMAALRLPFIPYKGCTTTLQAQLQ